MGLIKFSGAWVNPSEIVAAKETRPVTKDGPREAIKLLLTGGHEIELIGDDRKEVLVLLESLTKPSAE